MQVRHLPPAVHTAVQLDPGILLIEIIQGKNARLCLVDVILRLVLPRKLLSGAAVLYLPLLLAGA